MGAISDSRQLWTSVPWSGQDRLSPSCFLFLSLLSYRSFHSPLSTHSFGCRSCNPKCRPGNLSQGKAELCRGGVVSGLGRAYHCPVGPCKANCEKWSFNTISISTADKKSLTTLTDVIQLTLPAPHDLLQVPHVHLLTTQSTPGSGMDGMTQLKAILEY